MNRGKLLMISTDRKIFEEGSAVRARQVVNAKDWEEVHIVIFGKFKGQNSNVKNEPQETVVAPNCWAYSTKSRTKFMYPFDAISLGRFIIEKKGITDITCQDASLTAMAGLSLKKQFNIPLEIQIHEDIGSPYYGYTVMNKIRKILAKSYLPKADKIRVVSNRIKDYLAGTLGIESSKIDVRPIKVDIEKIKNAPIIETADLHKKYPQFEKIVLMASRLEREKNVTLAIQAWSEVIKKIPKAGLIIVGSGSESQKLKEECQKLGLDPSVTFEDWAEPSRLFSYYKTADLFLNTSVFEGYGMTLVEAQAAGCKIVSTDVGVAREVGAHLVKWTVNDITRGVVDILKA